MRKRSEWVRLTAERTDPVDVAGRMPEWLAVLTSVAICSAQVRAVK